MAWHRLALELKCSVAEAKERISAPEFIDWLAFYELRPFGPEWDDARMAVLSANIVQAFTGRRQEPDKHMARYRKPGDRVQSRKQIASMAAMMKAQQQALMAKRK